MRDIIVRELTEEEQEKVKKLLRENTRVTINSTLSSIYDHQEKLGEAFKQGIEDGLKGEQIMADMNTMAAKYFVCNGDGITKAKDRNQETDIHMTAIRGVVLSIQLQSFLAERRFLKQALLYYAERGEFDICNSLSSQLAILDDNRQTIISEISKIDDEYGNDMRYSSHFNYLTAVHKDIEREFESAKEDVEPAPEPKPAKKTKKSDGDAN